MSEMKDLSNNTISEDWTEEHKKIIYMVCKKTGLNELQAYKGLIQYNGDYKKVITIANMHKAVEIVVHQTTYTKKEAFEKLQENDWDKNKIIREFMGIKESPKKEVTTINQGIFSEIRGFMDTAMQGYNERKEHAERLKTLQALYSKDSSKN